MKDIKPFDEEERETIEAVENGDWQPVRDKALMRKYTEYARNTVNKNKRINIRMTEKDFRAIQVRAMHEGIPYQSLITMLIHKFNQGKIVIKN